MADDEPNGCDAWVMKRTLRCRLLGCKPGGDEFLHQMVGQCSCGRPTHAVALGETVHDVHEGCCVRCGQPILPTARVARR